MNKSTRLLITTAAMAGLYAGALATRSYAADDKAGKPDMKKDAKAPAHECAGKNGCKGEGGCKSGDNGCKGKNSCGGKGGCSTMAKTDKKAEKKVEEKPKA